MSGVFDAIIVGAGQAGPPLAARLSGAGMTVALIERHLFGGTCVNTGCTPTKTLVASARTAFVARRAAEFGVKLGGDVLVDMRAVQARQRKISTASRVGVEDWVNGLEHCTVFHGHARFVAPHEIRVGNDLHRADLIFLNVGSRAVVPDLPGIDDVPFLTNSSILELQDLPRHLVVVGGGYIGLEFAQMFRRFGSAVTVIERGPSLLGHEDKDIRDAICGIFEKEGIAVRLGAECIRFEARGTDVAVGVSCKTGAPEVVGSHVLVAMGRRPNTDDLGLESAGIAVNARGMIEVDNTLQTTVRGVYALGDCNGRGAFTHTAFNDFEIVAANLLDGGARCLADRVPAYALYIDPPLGRVGLTEAAATKAGRRFRVGQRQMTRVGRSVEKGETQGLMKVIVEEGTDLILGAAILGPDADEAVHGIINMINAGATAETYRHAVPIHPTVSELIPTILGELGPAQ